MPTNYEGTFVAPQGRFGIVVARFNAPFGKMLLEGAIDGLTRHGVDDDNIDIFWVPGAMEMPVVCQRLAVSGEYAALIALGAVIRGATAHFEHVSNTVTRGCADVALDTGVPVINAVLTVESLEQAMERSGTKAGNKGFDAAMGAIEMSDLLRQLPEGEDG